MLVCQMATAFTDIGSIAEIWDALSLYLITGALRTKWSDIIVKVAGSEWVPPAEREPRKVRDGDSWLI